ncbi:MAG: ATP-binding protein [Pseudomonadales bacterium]
MVQFIRTHRDVILTDWEEFARPLLPPDEGADCAELREAAGELLGAIADDMEGQTSTEDLQKSPAADRPGKAESAARALHTADRLAQKFSLRQVIAEYRALRASANQRWSARLQNVGPAELAEINRFNAVIDESMARAVRWYEARLSDLEEQLSEVAHLGEQRYRALAELSPDAILVHDGVKWLYANQAAAKLIGFEAPQDVVGHTVLEFVLPEYRALARERTRQVLHGEPSAGAEYQLRRQDGEVIDIEVVAAPTPWEGKTAAQVIVRDITERKQTEALLRESDRNKDEFLAMLAHELRNPLAPIQSGIEVLRMSSGDPVVVRRVLEMMGRQMLHLKRLVDDLLDVSRISRGRINLLKEPVDLVDVVRRTVEARRSIIQSGGRELQLDLPAEPLPVEADAVRLAQIIENLLDNAAKYSGVHGHIEVAVSAVDGEACVSVRDDGVGIAPEMLGEIFELFKQVDDRAQGLGVGLALVNRLAAAHGGSVEARSEGLGHGSEFVVKLPLMYQSRLAGTPAAGQPEQRLDGRRVLVVDDNRDAADSLGMVLSSLGADVRTAHDGASALAMLEEFAPHAVLLDIGMPGMDGYEVAAAIRARYGSRPILLVAVTGWGQEADRAQARAVGFDHHITKPADGERLKAIVAGAQAM